MSAPSELAKLKESVRRFFAIDPAENVREWQAVSDELIAATRPTPSPAAEVCPECHHNRVGLSGYCIENLPDAYGDLKGGSLCGHRCVFPPAPEDCSICNDAATHSMPVAHVHNKMMAESIPPAAPAPTAQPASPPHPNDWKYALSFALPEDFPDDLHMKILDAIEPYMNAASRPAQEQARKLAEKIQDYSVDCVFQATHGKPTTAEEEIEQIATIILEAFQGVAGPQGDTVKETE